MVLSLRVFHNKPMVTQILLIFPSPLPPDSNGKCNYPTTTDMHARFDGTFSSMPAIKSGKNAFSVLVFLLLFCLNSLKLYKWLSNQLSKPYLLMLYCKQKLVTTQKFNITRK